MRISVVLLRSDITKKDFVFSFCLEKQEQKSHPNLDD